MMGTRSFGSRTEASSTIGGRASGPPAATEVGPALRPTPAPDSPVPAASWRAIETIPVFVIAVILAFLLGSIVVVLVKPCAPQFVLTTLAGELAFALSVLGWVRYVDHGPMAALGAPRRPL